MEAPLRALCVANLVKLTDKVLRALRSTVGRDLLDLCVYGCYNMTDTGVVHICSLGITRFNSCGCYKITEQGRRYMFSSNPSIIMYNNPKDFGCTVQRMHTEAEEMSCVAPPTAGSFDASS